MFKRLWFAQLLAVPLLSAVAVADSLGTGFSEVDTFLSQENTPEDEQTEAVANINDRADLYHSTVGQLGYSLDFNNIDEKSTFTPPILRMLIMAGETPMPDHWMGYPSGRTPFWLENYHSSMRWKMEREFEKKLSVPRAFSDTFSLLETRLRTMRVTKSKERRDYLMEHH